MSAADLARSLAERAEDVCRYLLPNGRRVGHEWKVGSVEGEAGDSLGVRLTGEKAGLWADFGGDESGDLIGLWKAVRRVDVATACTEAEDWLGIPRRNGSERRPILRPVAPDAEPSHVHPRLGAPTRTWTYRDAQGRILGYVCRFDPTGERKQVLPQTWDGSTWNWKGFEEPRPLYGLERLAARPEAPVLVVEGEKCADAAAALLGGMVAVSWPGGCKAVDKVDFEPLRGRVVTFWPDADEPGKEAMERIAARLEQACRIVRPNGFDAGWDIADAAADGWDAARVAEWAKAHVEHWFPPPQEPAPLEETHERVSDWRPPAEVMLEDVSEPWPESINVFSRAAVPALPRGILPPAIEPFVFDQSEIVGSDPCILAIAALVCAAACTHDSIKLQPRRFDPDWRESARLWGAFVGDPSSKKSPALARAMSHVRKLDIDMAEETERAMPAYRLAEKRYRKAEERAADTPGAEPPEPPEKPPAYRLIAEDTTIEKLSDLLVDNRGGLLIHHDELSGFFGSFDAYRSNGGKDSAFWLQAYNGGPRRVDRVSRGSIIVPNLSVCIVGGIQPDKIREIGSKLADDGLVQRFMVTVASDQTGLGADRAPDRTAVLTYRGILDWLVKERGNEDPVRLSDGAIDVMRDIEERLKAYRAVDTLPLRLRSHLGKWDGLFCRLALLYHVIERMDHAEPHGGLVSQDNAERVRFFLLTYLLPHTMAFYDDVLGNSGALAHVQWIAGYLLAKGEPEVSTRDIFRAYRPWRALAQAQRDQIMATLETCGWVRPIDRTRRQTCARWAVNPGLDEQYKAQKEQEQQRREDVKKRLLRPFYES